MPSTSGAWPSPAPEKGRVHAPRLDPHARPCPRRKLLWRAGVSTETSFKNGNQQPAVWLAGPHGRLELVEVVSSGSPTDSQAAPGPIGYDHIVFTVHSLDDVLTTLRAAGSRVLIEPAARTMNGRKYRIAAVRDPDGLLLELGEQGPPA